MGSAVWQVFDGEGTFELGGKRLTSRPVTSSPCRLGASSRVRGRSDLDVFVFSDAPVYEMLDLARQIVTPRFGLS